MTSPSEKPNPSTTQTVHVHRKPHRALITAFPVVLDACVLCVPIIRDFILWAAHFALFRPLWSKDLLAELRRTLAKFGVQEVRIDYLVEQMTQSFPEAEVLGYESIVPSLTNQEKDRHVLAAAVVGKAQLIVTNNHRDFPKPSLVPFQVETIGPDDFLRDLLDVDTERMLDVLMTLVHTRKMPPKSVDDILAALVRAGCSGFAADLQRALDEEYADS